MFAPEPSEPAAYGRSGFSGCDVRALNLWRVKPLLRPSQVSVHHWLIVSSSAGRIIPVTAPTDWSLPKQWGKRWEAVFDTGIGDREGESFDGGVTIPVAGRSQVVFRRNDARE